MTALRMIVMRSGQRGIVVFITALLVTGSVLRAMVMLVRDGLLHAMQRAHGTLWHRQRIGRRTPPQQQGRDQENDRAKSWTHANHATRTNQTPQSGMPPV